AVELFSPRFSRLVLREDMPAYSFQREGVTEAVLTEADGVIAALCAQGNMGVKRKSDPQPRVAKLGRASLVLSAAQHKIELPWIQAFERGMRLVRSANIEQELAIEIVKAMYQAMRPSSEGRSNRHIPVLNAYVELVAYVSTYVFLNRALGNVAMASAISLLSCCMSDIIMEEGAGSERGAAFDFLSAAYLVPYLLFNRTVTHTEVFAGDIEPSIAFDQCPKDSAQAILLGCAAVLAKLNEINLEYNTPVDRRIHADSLHEIMELVQECDGIASRLAAQNKLPPDVVLVQLWVKAKIAFKESQMAVTDADVAAKRSEMISYLDEARRWRSEMCGDLTLEDVGLQHPGLLFNPVMSALCDEFMQAGIDISGTPNPGVLVDMF
ncbi:MAG TPA: hypothetical protein VJC18_06875, partial [bacterium]|nr:hypothetical protein [bacterium]